MAVDRDRPDQPELSVVLSTLGSYDLLQRVLDGFAEQDLDRARFEVLVVSDAAEAQPDSVAQAVGTRPYAVRILSGSTPGLSANRNTGWRAARAPIVLFTDNDTVPVPGLAGEHLRWHAENPASEVAVVGPVRWAPGLRVTPFMRWLEAGIQFDFGSILGTEASWAHAYGANLSVKRRLLETVGGYEETRLPYGHEDLEWGYRASQHGLRLLYNRKAIVDHWRTMDLEMWKVRARRVAASERRLCELHPEIPPALFEKFNQAAALPPQRGRAARLAGVVPRRTPWLGPLIWNLADIYWRQQIAPDFLSAWEAAAAQDAPEVQPGDSLASELATSSGGSPPGGPK